ncbi:LexA family protein [Deinococcus sp. 6YEL10]|uniref:LexA family protein n=1 Tax=Deinococcus sp. 6YEL10 TaxID=2745870 RepID=UPI001E388BAE|nr:S24 family peptidase [Deinococcus sp. 6YEL10]
MTRTEQSLQGRQRDVLLTIARLEQTSELISTALIARTMELPRQNIRQYLLALAGRGLIHYTPTERHTTPIHLTPQGHQALGHPIPSAGFPILGEVAAGPPTLTGTHVEGHALALSDVLPLHEGDFLLRVRGKSMTGIGIFPGDLVAIRPTNNEPLSGTVTLVVLPGEGTATLKRWHRKNGTVTLLSENPDVPPLTLPTADVQVQGELIGHIGLRKDQRS